MEIEGIINTYKPAGMTSHDCVQVLRKLTGVRKIGHTGTLDPMAEGVLPLCVGRAARIVEYLDMDLKTYRCGMSFGLTTETLDIWGKSVTDRREEWKRARGSGMALSESAIRDAFAGFAGIVEQIPPKYSALKVNGKRLYEYARAGEEVEIKKREIYIESLTIRGINLAEGTAEFDVTCSKGTYIRSICADVGEALGWGAAMNGLTRLRSGVFSIERATPLAGLAELSKGQLSGLAEAPDYPLVHFGKAVLNRESAIRFQNGGPIPVGAAVLERAPMYAEKAPPFPIREEYRRAYNVYERSGAGDHFLGVAFLDPDGGKLAPDKVF